MQRLVRLMPNRFKGAWWDRLGLPRPAADMWSEVPVLLPPPDGVPRALGPEALEDRRTSVLILHPYLVTGGAETVVLNLLSSIDRTRFRVHLLTTEGGPRSASWLQDPWLSKFTAECDSIFRLPVLLEREYFLRFLVEFVKAREIDVLLNSTSVFGYRVLAELRSQRPGMAVVDLLHAEAPYAPIDQVTVASEYRELLDRRVVTTETVRRAQVEKFGERPDRIVVIPNSVDTEGAFNPDRYRRGAFRAGAGIPAGATLVLFFGRIVAEKQPDHIVEVAERLRSRKDIVFVFVGEGAALPALERDIARRGLANVVVHAPLNNVAEAVADADCVLFPSKREGLPMAGIEALSMGRPVVASRVPGWLDLIEDGCDGFLIADGDFDGYARTILKIADDPRLRARLSAAGREKAITRFGLAVFARAWERVLLETMEVHRA